MAILKAFFLYYGIAGGKMTSFILLSCSVDVHTFYLKFRRGIVDSEMFYNLSCI